MAQTLCSRSPIRPTLPGPSCHSRLLLGQTPLAPAGSAIPSQGGRGTGAGALGQQESGFQAPIHSTAAAAPKDLVWRPLARMTLQRIEGLGLQSAFLRGANHQSAFWLMREPVCHGSLLSPPSWTGAKVVEALRTPGITTLEALRETTGPDLKETTELQARLGWRSQRNVERLLSHIYIYSI